jgi:hypothetical protein
MNASRRHIPLFAAVALILLLALTTPSSPSTSAAASIAAGDPQTGMDGRLAVANLSFPGPFAKQLAFHDTMRKLWEDHITWTRTFIISFLAGLPDSSTAAGRLLQNQTDIGNAFKPFYGKAAGDQLTALLRDHILIAADILSAAKAGDTAAFNAAVTRWYANADDIAAFLHSLNPENWPLDELRSMLRAHLDHTLDEAVARLHGDWAADVAAYDQIHLQALEMADTLSSGIIRQFPKKFT